MIITLPALFGFCVFVVWIYLRKGPEPLSLRRRQQRKRFDCAVLALALAGCGAVWIFAYRTVGAGADRAWWPIIATLYSGCVFPIIVAFGGMLRYIVFGRHRDR